MFETPKLNDNFNKDIEDKHRQDKRMFWQTIYIPAIFAVVLSISDTVLKDRMSEKDLTQQKQLQQLQQINAKMDSVLYKYNNTQTNTEKALKQKNEIK